jgi:hypothetical protein
MSPLSPKTAISRRFEASLLTEFIKCPYVTTQLTNNSLVDLNPQINNSGQVVWVGDDGTDKEIFYYDGNTVIQITDNTNWDNYPQINANGHVVWRGKGVTLPPKVEPLFVIE